MKFKDEVDRWFENKMRFAKETPAPPTRLVTHYHSASDTATNCLKCSDEQRMKS
jgi:hypothetical protein